MNSLKCIILILSFLSCINTQASIENHFNKIKKDPNALYAFFKAMPKGGELHYHLAGGPYPETMLQLAASKDYCLDLDHYTLSKMKKHCDDIETKDLDNKPEHYANTIRSWSMKDFVPGAESGHDHFFNSFYKFLPIVMDFKPQLIADVMQRAANQKELYLELLDIPDNGVSIGFGKMLDPNDSLEQKRKQLLANAEFQKTINQTVTEGSDLIKKAKKVLGCSSDSKAPGCDVQVRLQYYVLREQPLDNVFAQALNGFEAVSRSQGSLIGVNLVQAEDGIISLRDYSKQMAIFKFLHSIYPEVPIALHAGELRPGLVKPEDLNYHIKEALFIGQAKRIGHGVDIAYEDMAEETLSYMAKNQIPVEINLISNLKILNLKGSEHPLNYYLAHQVPVVLSTDDEGILRTDLTSQYVEAVLNHGLSYQIIKQINRNALTYAFLPGKSIWADQVKALLVNDCQDLNSSACLEFVKVSEKAKLQRVLELRLKEFENMSRLGLGPTN